MEEISLDMSVRATVIMIVTPGMAAEFLKKNGVNRPIRNTHVNGYAQVIREGGFKTTHQGLAFAFNGTLLDGQHRLLAIIKSGIAVEMMITTGLELDTFDSMDCGVTRKASDRVTFTKGVDRNAKLVAVSGGIHILISSRKVKYARNLVSAKVIRERYEEYKISIHTIMDEIFYKVPAEIKQSFINNRNVLAACVLYHHYHNGEGFEFASRLFHGAPSDGIDDPILVTRSYMTRKKPGPKEQMERLFWAMKAYHEGKKSKKPGKEKDPFFLQSEIVEEEIIEGVEGVENGSD